MGKLSDAGIRAMKAAERDRWIGDGRGLWLRVRKSGSRASKVFVVRSKRGGHTRILTLGEWPHYPLVKARIEAARVAADRSGAALPSDAANLTVKDLAEEYFETRIAPRYRRTKNAVTYRERLVRECGWRKLRDVQPVHLAGAAKSYAKVAPVAANRFLAFVKGCFGFGVESGYLTSNPAAHLSRNIAGGEETARVRVLTDDEIRKLWNVTDEHGRLLRFLLVTGARIGEAQLATWGNIDFKTARWRIPAAHAKNKREHWVHLPRLALEILGERGAESALALRSTSETAVQAWVRRWCERETIAPRFTPHDLRRTFATRIGSLGVAPHVIAKCLSHTLEASDSINVYLRAEYESERIEATDKWAAKLQEIVAPPPSENVVPLRRAS